MLMTPCTSVIAQMAFPQSQNTPGWPQVQPHWLGGHSKQQRRGLLPQHIRYSQQHRPLGYLPSGFLGLTGRSGAWSVCPAGWVASPGHRASPIPHCHPRSPEGPHPPFPFPFFFFLTSHRKRNKISITGLCLCV